MSSIAEAFAALASREGHRPLLHVPDRAAITASELQQIAERHGRLLDRARLAEGDLVVLNLGNTPAFVALLLACLSRGLPILAIDTAASAEETERLSERFGAAASIARSAETTDGITLRARPAAGIRYAGAAVLKMSSGSTDLPKAIVTTDAQLMADSLHIVAAMNIRPEDVQLASIPLAHAYGFSVVAIPALIQGTAVLLREVFLPQRLHADAEQFGLTRFPGVPFMFEHLLQHATFEQWPAGIRHLVSAGAPLGAHVARAFHSRFGVKIHAFYGTTETGGITYDDSDDPGIVHTVGRPLPGVDVQLRSEDGGAGRVHVRSDAVGDGYVGGTAGDFVDGGFLTGDYAHFDGNGRLILAGRVSSFINVAGRKVHPAEVENVLRELPGIDDVRVVAGLDDQRGEHVLACVVTSSASSLTSFAIRQHAAQHLAAHKIPRTIVFVDAIPLTARGKTNVDALHALIRERGARPRG